MGRYSNDSESRDRLIRELTGFTRPFCVQMNRAGEIFVGDFGSGEVSVYDQDLNKRWVFSHRFKGPHSISILENESIIICDYYACEILEFTPTGEFIRRLLSVKDGLNGPAQMRVAPNGDYIVSDYGSSTLKIFGREKNFHFSKEFDYGFDRLHSVAFDDESNAWVCDTWNHRIVKLDQNFNLIGLVEGKFDTPVSIDYSDGRFVISENGRSIVQCFSKEGKALWQRGGYSHPYDVKLKGDLLLVADSDHRRVVVERL